MNAVLDRPWLLGGGNRVPPGMSLGLSFMSPGVLDPRIVFTRASTATYFDSTGVLQTAATNAPRWDYDPNTRVLKGLLIEEARTNLTTQSGDFTNANWAKGAGITLTAGVPGPNGATTGSGCVSAAGSIGFLSQGFTSTAGTAFAMSCFVKAGSLSSVFLLMPASWWADATSRFVQFDLTTGVVTPTGSTASGTISAVGNGWYRITIIATPNVSAAGSPQFARASANGDGVTVQHYAFGAQLEAGAFPTSYIPTAASSVTRAIELAVMPTTGWYNASAGSLVTEFISQVNTGGNQDQACLMGADSTNMINTRVANSGVQAVVFVANANVGVAGPANTISFGVPQKMGMTYDAPTRVVSLGLNGGIPGSVIASSLPTITQLVIGQARTVNPNGYTRRVKYWQRALSQNELVAVTR